MSSIRNPKMQYFKLGESVVINKLQYENVEVSLSRKQREEIFSIVGIEESEDLVIVYNSNFEELTINESSYDGLFCSSSSIVLYGCQSGKYHIKTRFAKIYILSCTNSVITIEESADLINSTLEVSKCMYTIVNVNSRLSHIKANQIEKCSIKVRDGCFVVPYSMIRSVKEFKSLNLMTWIGCVDLAFYLGNKYIECDYNQLIRGRRKFIKESTKFQVKLNEEGILENFKFITADKGEIVVRDGRRKSIHDLFKLIRRA